MRIVRRSYCLQWAVLKTYTFVLGAVLVLNTFAICDSNFLRGNLSETHKRHNATNSSPGLPANRNTKLLLNQSQDVHSPRNGSEFLTMLIENTGKLELPIQKRTFSSRNRLLFVAGLEGTGHHGMKAMFDMCRNAKLCNETTDLSRSLETYHTGALHGLFSGADGDEAHDQVQTVFEQLQAIAALKERALIYIVGLGYVSKTGMMSYPNYFGKYKVLDHPDIAMLALLSEKAGIDLRVLILQRPANEVIASTNKRGFGGVIEPRILISNAQALYSQMTTIQSSFYHCLDYHTLGNMTEAHQLAFRHFVHPDIDDVLLKKMFSKIRYDSPFNITNHPALEKLRYDIFQLQLRQQQMDNLCEKQHAQYFAHIDSLMQSRRNITSG